MYPPPGVVVETTRLWLREMSPDDVDALYQILGDAETMRLRKAMLYVLDHADCPYEVIGISCP